MDDSIRIEIHCSNFYTNIAAVCGVIVIVIWILALKYSFSVGGLIAFIAALAAFCAFVAVDYKVPTVVEADNKTLRVKHLFGWKKVELSKITGITCEPYTVQTRYSSIQRIRLTLLTNDDDEIDLNDSVNTENILNDKLEAKETDIPIITLYEFLKKRIDK